MRAGDDLLAGAALARDQHRRDALGERFDEVDDPQHRRRAGDEPVRSDHALQQAVVVLGGTDHDEIPGARIAMVRDVLRDRRRRQRDETRTARATAQDGAPALLPPPVRQRLAQRVGGSEQLRADQLLDRPPDHGRHRSGARDLVEREAGAQNPEIAVQDDGRPAESLEDRFERGETRVVRRGQARRRRNASGALTRGPFIHIQVDRKPARAP